MNKKAIFYWWMTVFLVSCCTTKEAVNSKSEWWENTHKCDQLTQQRVGAMCNDGTRSQSTGSGTCSGHRGVKYWLCK